MPRKQTKRQRKSNIKRQQTKKNSRLKNQSSNSRVIPAKHRRIKKKTDNELYYNTIINGQKFINRLKKEIIDITINKKLNLFDKYWHPQAIITVNNKTLNRDEFKKMHKNILENQGKIKIKYSKYHVIANNMIYGNVIFSIQRKHTITIRFIALFSNETPSRIYRLWETLKKDD